MSTYTDLYRERQDIRFLKKKIKHLKDKWEDYERLTKIEKELTKQLKV